MPLTVPNLHRLVSLGLKQGIVNASDWAKSHERIEGHVPQALYSTIRRIRRNGRSFAGYGNWYSYLEAQYGVPRPEGARLYGKTTSSTEELKKLVITAIEKTYEEGEPAVSVSDWRDSERIVGSRTLGAVFEEVRRWKKNGRSFGGHGKWHVFLQKELGISPLRHRLWSDERFHRTVALLAEKYPMNGKSWDSIGVQALHGRSLKSFYEAARFSNKMRHRQKEKNASWFGHGSFAAYAAWAKKNYGTGSKYENEARKS